LSCPCCCPRRCRVCSGHQKQEPVRGSQREEERFVKVTVVRDSREQRATDPCTRCCRGQYRAIRACRRLASRSSIEITCRCLGKWSLKYIQIRLTTILCSEYLVRRRDRSPGADILRGFFNRCVMAVLLLSFMLSTSFLPPPVYCGHAHCPH
jgi:hypothetical protein